MRKEEREKEEKKEVFFLSISRISRRPIRATAARRKKRGRKEEGRREPLFSSISPSVTFSSRSAVCAVGAAWKKKGGGRKKERKEKGKRNFDQLWVSFSTVWVPVPSL